MNYAVNWHYYRIKWKLQTTTIFGGDIVTISESLVQFCHTVGSLFDSFSGGLCLLLLKNPNNTVGSILYFKVLVRVVNVVLKLRLEYNHLTC